MIKRRNKRWSLLILLLVFIAVNWAASVWHTRMDLTDENRFTLSKPTRALLDTLEESVHVDVFLKGTFPSGFKKLANSTEEMLNEFRETAGGNFTYNFISPEENVPGTTTSYGDSLASFGLYPINLTSQVEQGQQQQYVYPIALVHYGEKVEPVLLYKGKTPLINFGELSSAEAMLEYNLAAAVSRLGTTKKPIVAYATGNGQPEDFRTYDLIQNVLKTDYSLFTYNLKSPGPIPADFSTLLIVKPTQPFDEREKLKLDQYLLNGGRLLMFIDRLNAEMDSLQIKNEVIAYDRDLQVNDFLFKYGVRINADLVMDLQCDFLPFDVNGDGQYELLPWNYFPVLESPGNEVINKNLGFVAARFVNSIDTVVAEGITKRVLLNTSANSRSIATPALISGKENVNAPVDEKFNKAHIPVAMLLEGRFVSYFKNRLSTELNDSLNKYGAIFMQQALKASKMIVVADGDIPLNSVVKGGQPIPMGMNPYTYGTQREFPFANKDFVQSCLEYLTDINGLAEAKSKDYVVRLLDTKKLNENIQQWRLVTVLLPVVIVVIFGVIFYWIRKKKYAGA